MRWLWRRMRLRRLWIWQLRIPELRSHLRPVLRRMLRWRLWLRRLWQWRLRRMRLLHPDPHLQLDSPYLLSELLVRRLRLRTVRRLGGGYCGGPCYGGCGYGGGCGFNGCCEPNMVFNDGCCGGCGGCGCPAPCGSCCGGSPIMQGYPTGGCSSCGVAPGPTAPPTPVPNQLDRPLLSPRPCTVRLRIARRCRWSREQADRSSIPVTRR